MRVIVVGAGLSGLVCALRLRASGCEVTVLERGERAGGVHARETLAGVDYAALPAFAPGASRVLAGLTAELGLDRALVRLPLERIGWLRDGRVRAGSSALRERMGAPLLRAPRLRRLALLQSWLGAEIDPEAPERNTRLDDRSVADFCRVYLGRRALDQLVAPLLATAFGLDAARSSRQLLFALLDGRAHIPLEVVPGSFALVEALASRVGAIRFGAEVESIEPDGRGVVLAGGERIPADAVALATCAAEALRLVPEPSPAERAAAEGIRPAPALVLALATRVGVELPARLIAIPAREGGELAGVVDATPADASGARLLQLVARPDLFARHGQRPDDELAHFLIESAERGIPGLRDAIEARRLHRVPHARAGFEVGHYRALERLRASLAVRSERRIALAGGWVCAPHLEGELCSGERAATELCAQSES